MGNSVLPLQVPVILSLRAMLFCTLYFVGVIVAFLVVTRESSMISAGLLLRYGFGAGYYYPSSPLQSSANDSILNGFNHLSGYKSLAFSWGYGGTAFLSHCLNGTVLNPFRRIRVKKARYLYCKVSSTKVPNANAAKQGPRRVNLGVILVAPLTPVLCKLKVTSHKSLILLYIIYYIYYYVVTLLTL